MTNGSRRYQKVLWHHDLPDEPVVLYAEISSGREVRKVEGYRDGRNDYADTSRATGTTMLSEIPTPPDYEINQDPQFSATAIPASEFEHIWQHATQPRSHQIHSPARLPTFPRQPGKHVLGLICKASGETGHGTDES